MKRRKFAVNTTKKLVPFKGEVVEITLKELEFSYIQGEFEERLIGHNTMTLNEGWQFLSNLEPLQVAYVFFTTKRITRVASFITKNGKPHCTWRSGRLCFPQEKEVLEKT